MTEIVAGAIGGGFTSQYSFISFLLWTILLVFLIGNAIWFVEMLYLGGSKLRRTVNRVLGRRLTSLEKTHSLDEVQVRVLTIGAEDVVQQTINSLPEGIRDRHVIAEEPMDITGATVHVVPDSFECEATKKGRALEWARRHVTCETEYILYLDEDTLVGELSELPDADVIQYRERPLKTTSMVAYLCELLRMGYQIEQRSFSKLSYPFYAWGGGIAVRADLENEITWDYDTITEDTVFVWKAATVTDLEFETVVDKFHNQAPPSLREMIKQRRRWFSGGVQSIYLLPRRYQLAFWFRSIAWALTPAYPIVLLLSVTTETLAFSQSHFVFSVILTGFLYVWALLGMLYTKDSVVTGLVLFVFTPLVAFLHSLGAVWGLVSPVEVFESTTKVEQTSANTKE